MMNEATHALEEIRRTELETARHVEEARARAKEIEAEAKAEGRRLVDEGRERGRAAARRHLEETLEGTEKVAAKVRARAKSEAEALGHAAARSMDVLIEEMVGVLLAPPSEPGK